MIPIDWTAHDKHPESTCTCGCGATFRSHAKAVMERPGLESRKPCPACGKADDLRRISSDPELYTIDGRGR